VARQDPDQVDWPRFDARHHPAGCRTQQSEGGCHLPPTPSRLAGVVDLVKDQLEELGGALTAAGGLKALGKLAPWQWWVIAIAIAVTLVVDLIVALWAPADLIIEDSLGLTAVELAELTSPDFPSPGEDQYTSSQDIEVRRQALDKLPTQYREQRRYHSPDEESTYLLTLRFNRVA
jgi:hypothetical protein